jgi:hypothetical protein
MWDRVELAENGPKKDVKEERKKERKIFQTKSMDDS